MGFGEGTAGAVGSLGVGSPGGWDTTADLVGGNSSACMLGQEGSAGAVGVLTDGSVISFAAIHIIDLQCYNIGHAFAMLIINAWPFHASGDSG